MAADPFALVNRSLNRGYPGRGYGGRGRGRGRDPRNPKDVEYLRAMHPDYDELMGNADVDYRTMCNQDAGFAEKFKLPPVLDPQASFREHDNSVDSVCWGPESGQFLSASHDKTIKVWDATSGKCLQTLQGHDAGVFHCSVSPTGRSFVSCGAGSSRNVLLWQWPEGKVSMALEGHKKSVHHAGFSCDGKYIASTDQEGFVVVHDATRPAPLSSRQLHLGVSDASSFCRQDSNLLCSVGRDGHVQMTDLRENHLKAVWNLPSMAANGSFRTSLGIHNAHDGHTIYGAEFVDSKTLYTCAADHKLKRWDLRMVPSWRADPAEYLGHSAPLRSLTVSPNGDFIVTGCEDGSCRIWHKDELGHVRARRRSLKAELQKSNSPAEERRLRQESDQADRHEQQCIRNGYGTASVSLSGHVSLVSGCAWQDDKENEMASILSCSWDQSIKLFKVDLKALP